jgi:hypothetical protein
MIFAREISDPLTSLVKKVDAATARHKAAELGSFVVFCSDDEKLAPQLKKLAEKEQLRHTVLTIDNPAGPEGYKVTKEADVIVVLYVAHKVQASHAFRKGQLTAKDIDRVLGDLPRILPKQ